LLTAVWSFWRLHCNSLGKKEGRQFLAGGLLVLAYFGAIVATMLPR
jgi:hypothetical protein